MFKQKEYGAMERKHRLLAATGSFSTKAGFSHLAHPEWPYQREEMKKSERLLKDNPNFLLIGDPDYPEGLYDITWPPLILYYKGDATLLKRAGVGIVGSRKCTAYGQKVTREFASALAKIGAVIVSGGARGVDTVAHEACLKESGKTICVLGSGIDISYPCENQGLFQQIGQQGLMVTEYPKGFKPERWTFPMRNRIIAALSQEIIVTEAAEKSGSLITATFGEELNRRIYAIPHDITSYNGVGNHHLIEMGARILFDRPQFILEYMENHPASIVQRIKDLALQDLHPSLRDLMKIFGLQGENEKNILQIVKKIHEGL